MKNTFTFVFGFFFALNLFAEEAENSSPVIFIYDSSGSMWGQIDGTSKMEIAKSVLTEAVNSLDDQQQIGFVAYGHRNEADCEDVETLVDVENGTKEKVVESLTGIKPLGKTPLAYSAKLVIDRLRETGLKSTVILITDGIESCDGNICDVINAAKKEGIEFRLHIVGFGLKEGETEQLKCAAESGDGNYYDAADAKGLSEVLDEATKTTVDNMERNYTVYALKNGKPIDAYVEVVKPGTKERVDVERTYGDTAFLFLPPGTYDMQVKPLQNSDVSSVFFTGVESVENKTGHKTVSFDAAKIEVNVLNNDVGWDALVKILSKETGKNVAQMRTYGRNGVMDVNPGTYNVEITALAISGLNTVQTINDVVVNAGDVKKLEHQFETGTAMIGARSGDELVDATVNVFDAESGKRVAGGRTYTASSSNPRKFVSEYRNLPGSCFCVKRTFREKRNNFHYNRSRKDNRKNH